MAEQKLSGMEQMLNSLLKAAGFDPRQITENIDKTVKGFQGAMQALQDRLDKIDQRQTIIDARLERIEIHLAISPRTEDNGETIRRLTTG